MSNDSVNRTPSGVPAGGEFATSPKAEPQLALTPRPKHTVGISALAVLDTYGVEPLPQWPADLPEPSTFYGWDEDGQVETRIVFGPDTLTVWGPVGNASDSFTEIPDEYEHLSAEARDQVGAYGYRLHENISSLTGQVDYAAHTPQVRNAVMSIAEGHGTPQPCDDPSDPAWRTPAQRATARTEANLRAWFGEQIHEATFQDVLTDLLHYADSQGMKPTDFGAALNRAQSIHRDEIEGPEG